MKTTVMFVADSEPLGTVGVRLADEGDTVRTTDSEGKIEYDLEPGTHTFHVQYEDDWIERTVHREGHSPLFVVNVRAADTSDMSALNTLQIDLANLVGDRYVFETVLGRGGMGIVVKAVDRMLNRPVAIKMLSDELKDNEEAQQIFLVEARNLATLSHPNLVAIHDILNVSGRVLMVFEYVLGENIEKQIKKEGKLTPTEVLRIAIQLTRCVSYLHEHDLIHRDLKPANIIMQADGTLKLIDFGLARSLNDLYIRGTRVRGTPAYMAPEQIQGIHLTAATDLYQIGISMYEMLAGDLPFDTGDMAYAHVHVEPPPIAEAVPGIDPELADLLHMCLEKRPQDRPDSAELLLHRLQAIYARVANAEAAPAGLYDVSSTGPLPAVDEDDPPAIVDVEELSFADEVTGGSNRGLVALAALGLVALGMAGWLWVSRAGTDTPADNAAVDPTPTPQNEPVPVDVVERAAAAPAASESIETARVRVRRSVATADGDASSQPADSVDPEPPTPARPTARRHEPRPRHAVRTKPKRAVAKKPDKTRPPAPQKKARPEHEEPLAPSEEKASPTDLLSVDDESGSNTLLPVNE